MSKLTPEDMNEEARHSGAPWLETWVEPYADAWEADCRELADKDAMWRIADRELTEAQARIEALEKAGRRLLDLHDFCPAPETLRAMVGEEYDRLTHRQRMLAHADAWEALERELHALRVKTHYAALREEDNEGS